MRKPNPAGPRLLSFLREEAERERLEEVERLKPVGTAVGPYTEYRCTHVLRSCGGRRASANRGVVQGHLKHRGQHPTRSSQR